MISSFIIDAILKQAKPENKDNILKMFIEKLGNDYPYNDSRVNHVLELLVNPKAMIEKEHINMDYINKNFNKWIYQYDKVIIKDIAFKSIDNIEELVYISYSYKAKLNEDRDDIDFTNTTISISFIDYPEVLKKS